MTTPIITVHRGINTNLRPISVNGKVWGFARLADKNVWTIHANAEHGSVVSRALGVRKIEFAVQSYLKQVA